jgi:dephospho-CoA kinase
LLRVGLTGAIASGKSVAAAIFAALGAHVIQADRVAHDLMQPGQPVFNEVVGHFGSAILNPDGTINRSRLAEAAFSSSEGKPSRIQVLNQIVHPHVIRKQEQWMEDIGQSDPNGVAIVEAALILEAGAANRFERLIVITCRPEQRIERWAKRMKVDEETARREVTRRMAAQFSDEEKIKAADYVIDNSGSLDATKAQVEVVYWKLQNQAAR